MSGLLTEAGDRPCLVKGYGEAGVSSLFAETGDRPCRVKGA